MLNLLDFILKSIFSRHLLIIIRFTVPLPLKLPLNVYLTSLEI